MFDTTEPVSKKLWRKLAMTLIYAKNQDFITNYKSNMMKHIQTDDLEL